MSFNSKTFLPLFNYYISSGPFQNSTVVALRGVGIESYLYTQCSDWKKHGPCSKSTESLYQAHTSIYRVSQCTSLGSNCVASDWETNQTCK